MSEERDTPELSLVVPVYNGSRTIGPLVEQIEVIFATKPFDIILVNDGSEDESEMMCSELAEKFPQTVTFVNLSRNFGEHNAVLAGLSHARGQYVAVLDDDGQNPPREILRMLEELKRNNYDVVYGRYVEKKHSWFRNAGSWFNDRVATFLLQKPKDLYFSSFKVMNRFLVNEIIKYRGPYPYTDGLIYRTTRKIGQVLVEHRANLSGASRYTFRKLVRLWLNMFLNFSIKPLRLSAYIGLFTSCLSVLGLICIFIDKIWIEPGWPVGIPTVLASIVFFGLLVSILGAFIWIRRVRGNTSSVILSRPVPKENDPFGANRTRKIAQSETWCQFKWARKRTRGTQADGRRPHQRDATPRIRSHVSRRGDALVVQGAPSTYFRNTATPGA
jgi:glycosyltransferase involved in cell wall biosynthesis